MNPRTHVDLFTGIGGFSLAARANGVRTIAMCESDPRCQAFLAKAWPGVPVWPDVRTFKWGVGYAGKDGRGGNPENEEIGLSQSQHEPEPSSDGMADARRIGSGKDEPRREPSERAAVRRSGSGVWLLTAGVPCQPASRAGKQRGKDDDRWLWKEAVSVFAAIRPAWGLFENPPGIGDVGLAGILSDLGREGYAVRVFSLGACALGAPHRRMRYWIISRKLVADTGQPGRERPDAEPGAERLHTEHPESERIMCKYPAWIPCPDCENYWCTIHRMHAHDCNCPAIEDWGDIDPYTEGGKDLAHTPQRGQREHGSASGDAGHADQCGEGGLDNSEATSRRSLQDGQEFSASASNGRLVTQWSNFVWLPCADGKVRRAPDDSFRLVDGLHRSVLGALGNSIVPQIAAQIIQAMISVESLDSEKALLEPARQ